MLAVPRLQEGSTWRFTGAIWIADLAPPTDRYGVPLRGQVAKVTSQMRNFLDQTGPLWATGALVGTVGSVFTGSGTQHGGQESTILTMIPTLLHHGMVVVGLPYVFQGLSRTDDIIVRYALRRLHHYQTR